MPIPANLPELIRSLHETYCARTGYDIRYNMLRENQWRDWLSFGGYEWTVEDLKMTIAYLVREIDEKRRGREGRNEGCLKFHNLIGSPDQFEQDLASARKAMPRRASAGASQRPQSAPAAAPAPVTPEAAKADFAQIFGPLVRPPLPDPHPIHEPPRP